MRNGKRSRLLLTTAVILLGVLILSPLLGSGNPASALTVVAASNFNLYLPLVLHSELIQVVPTATATEPIGGTETETPPPTTPEPTATSTPEPTATSTPVPTATFTPGPPVPPAFGAEMDDFNGAGVDLMAAANMTWVRRNAVVWSSIEPTEGTYNWSAMADLASQLKAFSNKGIQVILEVRSTPEWARKYPGTGPSCGPIRLEKMAAFGNFMHALVERYSVAPYHVKYWEIWNEPDYPYTEGDNLFGCWGDWGDPYFGGGYYAEVLKAAYPQIKIADPQGQVLIGGLLLDCDPRPGAGCAIQGKGVLGSFLEGILRNNGGPYFDAVSFHSYDIYWGSLGVYINPNWASAWNTTGPVLIAKSDYIKSVLNQYSVTGKYLMNTETAVICGRDGLELPCLTADSANTKVYYLAQNFAAAIAQGIRANIWYSVYGWRNSALLDGYNTPLPAYYAFKFVTNELSDVAYAGVINSTDINGASNVKGYIFQRSNRRIWVLWSLDGNTQAITLPGVPLAAYDSLGNSVSPASTMNVSLNPLFLEWNP
jgi:hypothetical protein